MHGRLLATAPRGDARCLARIIGRGGRTHAALQGFSAGSAGCLPVVSPASWWGGGRANSGTARRATTDCRAAGRSGVAPYRSRPAVGPGTRNGGALGSGSGGTGGIG